MDIVLFVQLLNLLEKEMQDLDDKLQESENYTNQWKTVTVDGVQDQSENMKVWTSLSVWECTSCKERLLVIQYNYGPEGRKPQHTYFGCYLYLV